MNPTVQIDHILEKPDKHWNRFTLSVHPNITPEMMSHLSQTIWVHYRCCASNPNVTLSILFADQFTNTCKWWDTLRDNKIGASREVNLNPHVTWKVIQSHPEVKWNYGDLSSNENITWEIVESNLHLPWNITNLCYNQMSCYHDVFLSLHQQYVKKQVHPEFYFIYTHPRHYQRLCNNGHFH